MPPRPVSPYRVILFAAFLVVVGLLIHELVTLLVLALVTVLLSIPIGAIATLLERARIPRAIGAAVGLLVLLAAVTGVLMLIVPQAVDQGETFVDDLPRIADQALEGVSDVLGTDPAELGEDLQDYLQGLIDEPSKLAGRVTSVGLSILSLLATLLIVLITAYFIAARPEPLVRSGLGLVPYEYRETAETIVARLRAAWVGWLQGIAIDMAISGTLLYIGLSLVGIEFALLFAVFSALLVVIPYFGAFLGGIPPVLFALTDSPGKALLVLGIYLLVQQIEGNLTMPLVMANRVRLHPAAIAIGVVAVGQLLGIAGLLVAVPIISAVVIVVDEVWVKPNAAAAVREGGG